MLQRLPSLLCLLLAGPLACQVQPDPETNRFLGLRHFDARHANLLVVADLRPHIQRLLANPRVRALGDDPRLARDLRDLRDQIAGAAHDLPRELVVGASADALEQLARLVHVIAFISQVSVRDALREAPRDELVRQLRALRVPELRAWLRPREASDAARMFRAIADASNRAEAWGVTVRRENVELSLAWEASVLDAELMRDSFLESGLLVEDDPAGDALIEAIRALSVHARVKLEDGGLLLTIAADGTAGARAAPVPEPDAGTLAWARYDLGEAASMLADLHQLWPGQLPPADPGREALFGSLRLVAAGLRDLGRRGEARLWSADGLRGELVMSPAPPATPLMASGLMALVCAELPGVVIDGTASLDALLSGLVGLTGIPLEQRPWTYLTAFCRRLLDDASPQIAPPMAVLYQLDQRADRTPTRDFTGLLLDPSSPALPRVLEPEPVPELMVIGRAKRPQTVLDDLTGAYQKAVDASLALVRASGVELAAHVDQGLASPRELGLGVPTMVFSGRWAVSSMELPRFVLRLDEVVVHAFTIGDFVVLSTSPRLSKIVVETARGERATSTIPETAGGALIAWHHATGRTIVDLAGCIAQWKELLDASAARTYPDGTTSAVSGFVLDARGALVPASVPLWRSLAGLISEYDLRVSQDGSVRTTRIVLR